MPCRPGAPGAWGCGLRVPPHREQRSDHRKYPAVKLDTSMGRPLPTALREPSPRPACRVGAQDTSGHDPGIGAAGCGVPGRPLPLGQPTHPPQKPSQRQKRSSLELKCAVFLKGREMSHRKYYKKGLSLSAVQTLLRPHALYSGSGAEPLLGQRAEPGPGPGGGAAGGDGGWGWQPSARRSAASGASVQRPQPASSDAGSQGRRSCLLTTGSSRRLSRLQNFCSGNAYKSQRTCVRWDGSSGTWTCEMHRPCLCL